jgi:hypothetical protein
MAFLENSPPTWIIDCSDYTDSREVQVIAPIGYPELWIAVPSDGHSKGSTFVVCIAADGFRMKTFVIVPRVTVEKELKHHGDDESNAILTFQTNAFMTTALFELWAITVFFPTVERGRQDLAYDGRALLLLDGLGSHHTVEFLRECEARKIEILPLIPHASDQIQPLDVLIFALLNQTFSASRFNQLANPQSKKSVHTLGPWFTASPPHHNVEAFMSVCLITLCLKLPYSVFHC